MLILADIRLTKKSTIAVLHDVLHYFWIWKPTKGVSTQFRVCAGVWRSSWSWCSHCVWQQMDLWLQSEEGLICHRAASYALSVWLRFSKQAVCVYELVSVSAYISLPSRVWGVHALTQCKINLWICGLSSWKCTCMTVIPLWIYKPVYIKLHIENTKAGPLLTVWNPILHHGNNRTSCL